MRQENQQRPIGGPNQHPEPGLPSERAVTERLADAVATGLLSQSDESEIIRDAGRRGTLRYERQGLHCITCDTMFASATGFAGHYPTCYAHIRPMTQADRLESVRHRPETITEEAQRLVLGDRQDDYGHPADDFAKTGRMWGAVLEDWVRAGGGDVPPELVALMMVCVKISREVNRPKRDNRVDGIGYMLTAELIHERGTDGLG